jgi:membrane associated rhomboid family serine protease
MGIKYLSEWRNDDSFQKNSCDDYVVSRIFGNDRYGYSAARSAAEKWSLSDGRAIGISGSPIKLPALCISEFHDFAKKNYKKQIRIIAIMLAVFLVLFALNIIRKGAVASTIGPTIIIALTLLDLIIDQQIYLRKNENLIERARFIYWLISSKNIRRGFSLVLLLCASLFIAQSWLESIIGGRDALFGKFGFVYANVAQGEYWRILTGPWLHASFAHLANNAVMTAIVAPFLYYYSRTRAVAYFLCGALIGQVAQWLIFPVGDVLVGISGGTFTLYGAALGICIRHQASLPQGVYLKVAYVGIVSIFAAYLLNPHSAGICHIFGFSIGLLGELFLPDLFLSDRNVGLSDAAPVNRAS